MGGFVVLLGGLFFAIPQTRHLVIKRSTESVGTPGTGGGPATSEQRKVRGDLAVPCDRGCKEFRICGGRIEEALSAKLFQLKEVHVASSDDTGKLDIKSAITRNRKKLGANLIVSGMVQGSLDQIRITVKLDNVGKARSSGTRTFPECQVIC